MNIEYQLQIAAVKGERIYFKEYGDLTFISDGYAGVYLKEHELKIDKSKITPITSDTTNDQFDPKRILEKRTKAIEARTAYVLHRSQYAIKLYSEESGEHCFVDEKYLKAFGRSNALYIKSLKDPVFVQKHGIPYGIILPAHIPAQED